MTQFVALLRGVNVGGITVTSADLRTLFDELGFTDVRTVLASGNVTFASAKRESHAALKGRIERALRDRFGYDAWIVLVTRAELERAVDAFPFEADDAKRQPWVIFTSEAGVVDELMRFADEADADVDPLAAGEGVVYWNPVKGTTVGTPFAKLLAKPKYKPLTTNRNLRTLRKILG
ncbi:uncharacterized protein (DUF1697 family) [Agromyces ramosus]|jgi:uncharacterized protein (DUF1697 family)|uniref:Uncharacterized protein (DUF1697 family) n=1 Tax=Agromyces ramosus TaxID=33879 RepID=A0A4V2EZD9_9MICO|nr:DUF1697 domain-containing protein [Agromyces ramosus]RZS66150.1 uncharacterized protein (DUF1697 family) [Agromyces ramosus]